MLLGTVDLQRQSSASGSEEKVELLDEKLKRAEETDTQIEQADTDNAPDTVLDNENADEPEVKIKKKSGARRDENQILRREQIESYNSKVLRENRERRYRMRNGETLQESPESPKKKKCVKFQGPS